MSNVLSLRKVLQKELSALCSNTYYEEASNVSQYPYIVYEIESIAGNYQVEINIYNKSSSTVHIEKLADNVETLFKDMIYSDDEQVFTTSLNVRNSPKEEDKKIKRRRLVIDLLHYWKEM